MKNHQNFKNYFCSLILILSVSSCNSNKANDLELSVSINKMGLIGGNGYSCYDIKSGATTGSIAPHRTFFPRLKLKFGVDEEFFITGIKIKLSGSNAADTVCQFSELEIQSLFNSTMSIPAGGTSKVPQVLESDPQCRIYCGGIAITDDSRPASLNGNIIIDGYYIKHDDEGNEVEAISLRAMAPVSTMYTP